jgi:hypothetical protein
MATKKTAAGAAQLPDTVSKQHPSTTKPAVAGTGGKAVKLLHKDGSVAGVMKPEPITPEMRAEAVKRGRAAARPDGEAKASMRVRKGADRKYALPKTLGACADRYYELRNQRLDLTHQADDVKGEEGFVKEHLIASLDKDTTGVAGRTVRVAVVRKVIPQAEDWGKIYRFIVDEWKRLERARKDPTVAFALLNRALNATAVQERWENKTDVPGVGRFNDVGLSVNKL